MDGVFGHQGVSLPAAEIGGLTSDSGFLIYAAMQFSYMDIVTTYVYRWIGFTFSGRFSGMH